MDAHDGNNEKKSRTSKPMDAREHFLSSHWSTDQWENHAPPIDSTDVLLSGSNHQQSYPIWNNGNTYNYSGEALNFGPQLVPQTDTPPPFQISNNAPSQATPHYPGTTSSPAYIGIRFPPGIYGEPAYESKMHIGDLSDIGNANGTNGGGTLFVANSLLTPHLHHGVFVQRSQNKTSMNLSQRVDSGDAYNNDQFGIPPNQSLGTLDEEQQVGCRPNKRKKGNSLHGNSNRRQLSVNKKDHIKTTRDLKIRNSRIMNRRPLFSRGIRDNSRRQRNPGSHPNSHSTKQEGKTKASDIENRCHSVSSKQQNGVKEDRHDVDKNFVYIGLRKYFKCIDCDKTFKHRSKMIRHRRIHTGEKPFQCSECEKTFRQRCHLRVHFQIHVRAERREEESRKKRGNLPCVGALPSDIAKRQEREYRRKREDLSISNGTSGIRGFRQKRKIAAEKVHDGNEDHAEDEESVDEDNGSETRDLSIKRNARLSQKAFFAEI